MNNEGWGLKIMLVFCAIFMFIIIMAAGNVNKSFVKTTPKNYSTNKLTYSDLEVKMVNATKKYTTVLYNNIEEDITIPIKLSTLTSAVYLVPVKDLYTNENCSGYVLFKVEENSKEYKPYLKCDHYKTTGYDKKFE